MDRRGFLGNLGRWGAGTVVATKAVSMFNPVASAVEEHPAIVGYVEGEPVYDDALVYEQGTNFVVKAPRETIDEAKIVINGAKGVLVRWPRGAIYRLTTLPYDLEYLGRMVKGVLVR